MDPFRRVIVTVTPSLRLLVNIEPGSCERVRGRLKLTVTDLNFTGDWSLSRMMMLRLPLRMWKSERTLPPRERRHLILRMRVMHRRLLLSRIKTNPFLR